MMKSMGGLSRHDKVVDQPITIAYSGPSAGVLGMAWLAEKVGESRVLTYDMGGTSTDVALVEDGRPLLTTEGSLDIYPMKTPTIDLVSIGAGGGSIATLGTGNRLRVGPESAGADPGPACYGRGGTQATVTDANLVLGRIPPALLSGTLALDEEAARAAIGTIAGQLALSLEEAAYGILEIAAFTMAGAVREVSVKRGRDPREYALFAYGGAGPLHAAQLASLLGISRIVIPASPGLGSCIGLLAADIKETAVQTVPTREDQPGLAELGERFAELEDRVQKAVIEQGIEASQVELERLADMRYVGMATELTVTVPSGRPTLESMRLAFDAFHAAHERAYGYAYRGEQLVEVINIRVSGTGPLSFIDLSEEPVSPRRRRRRCDRSARGLLRARGGRSRVRSVRAKRSWGRQRDPGSSDRRAVRLDDRRAAVGGCRGGRIPQPGHRAPLRLAARWRRRPGMAASRSASSTGSAQSLPVTCSRRARRPATWTGRAGMVYRAALGVVSAASDGRGSLSVRAGER